MNEPRCSRRHAPQYIEDVLITARHAGRKLIIMAFRGTEALRKGDLMTGARVWLDWVKVNGKTYGKAHNGKFTVIQLDASGLVDDECCAILRFRQCAK